jgi:hypothetical protein
MADSIQPVDSDQVSEEQVRFVADARLISVLGEQLIGSEKAGVGGSTPSLATTFQSSYIESAKSLQSAFSPLLAAVAPPRMA